MGRPSKKMKLSRAAGAAAGVVHKAAAASRHSNTNTRNNISSVPEVSPEDSENNSNNLFDENCKFLELVDDDIVLSDIEDDIITIGRPVHGWKEAERNAPGYSRTNAGKTPSSRTYYKKKKEKKKAEGEELNKVFGKIDRFLATDIAKRPALPPFTAPQFTNSEERAQAQILKEKTDLELWVNKNSPTGELKK